MIIILVQLLRFVREVLHYYYDVKEICGFKYNGMTYYCVKNIPGDIVAMTENDDVCSASLSDG